MNKVQHVFLIGAKSLGAYGGYETFINKLTEYHKDNENIQYHIAVKGNGSGSISVEELEGAQIISDTEFIYNNAHCFKIYVEEKMGSAQAIYYDVQAIKKACDIIERDKIANAIVYIMTCRIGPWAMRFYKKIHKLGGKVYLNPDGHEWKRAKWSWPVRKYWKHSEKLMVKYSDLVVCDSINIEKYIHENYDKKGINKSNPKTTYIAYGAETRKSKLSNEDPKVLSWYNEKKVKPNNYYLVVGRFVPENNYEVMIREFLKAKTNKDFVIITNVNDDFLGKLEKKLHFSKDKRIKFVGTVYDQELLMMIRENAYGYFHGHEVGGTNPSLLEALGATKLNILLNVGFNKEVAEDAAVYWNKKEGNLASVIEKCDSLSSESIDEYGLKAKKRIIDNYSWNYISDLYEKIFLE